VLRLTRAHTFVAKGSVNQKGTEEQKLKQTVGSIPLQHAWLRERRWIWGCAWGKLCVGGLKLRAVCLRWSWEQQLTSARLSLLPLAARQPAPLAKRPHCLYVRQVPSRMQVMWMARTQIWRAAHQAALAHPQRTVCAVKAHYVQQYATARNCSCDGGKKHNA